VIGELDEVCNNLITPTVLLYTVKLTGNVCWIKHASRLVPLFLLIFSPINNWSVSFKVSSETRVDCPLLRFDITPTGINKLATVALPHVLFNGKPYFDYQVVSCEQTDKESSR
jgi:hypothetical protein